MNFKRLASIVLSTVGIAMLAGPVTGASAGRMWPNQLGATESGDYQPCTHVTHLTVDPPFGMGGSYNVYVRPWIRSSSTGKWSTWGGWNVIGQGREATFTNTSEGKPASAGWEYIAYVNGRWTTPFYEAVETIEVLNSYTNLVCLFGGSISH